MSRDAEIAERVGEVRERLAEAARRAGRDPADVTLVAVGKTKPLSDLLAAHAAGVLHFGENRVQEAEAKLPGLPPGCVLHLIGPLQSNKVNRAARLFHVVQTIDSLEIAGRVSRVAEAGGKTIEVYVEVNSGGESTKAGVAPADAEALVDAVRALPSLALKGLMTIPPPGDTRPHFVACRALAARLGLPGLSMGMSDDFEAAVEEGATLVRIGSALFGARDVAG